MPIPTRMLLFVAFVSSSAAAGPVYRCPGADGVLRFTDRACPGIGEKLSESDLRPNVYTPEPLATLNIEEEAPEPADDDATGCDNADDLRHIDLMLKSLTTDPRQRSFLRKERRRVANCQLASLPPEAREKRDAALRRTGSLRSSTRDEAEQEIDGLYGSKRPAKRSGKRPRKRR
jgi:hypothetical protein